MQIGHITPRLIDLTLMVAMNMWFLIFFLTPVVEMYLLIEVGGYIGALPTIGLVMLTAVIGVALLRIQGLATLTKGIGRLQRGELPAREMVEGLLLAVAGALLLTPGFFTDGVGFLLLAPPSRALIAQWVLKRASVMNATGSVHMSFQQGPTRPSGAGPTPAPDHRGSGAIDGEFVRLDEHVPGENPSAEGEDDPNR